MARKVDNDEEVLAFQAGMNNTASETALPEGAVRSLVNLDLVSGQPFMREGRTLRYPSTDVHSLWSDDLIDFGLFMEGTDLKALLPSLQTQTLRSGLAARDMEFAFVNNRVYYSNGVDTGVVRQSMDAEAWGVETPRKLFQAEAVDGGGLHAGTYRVTFTFLAGREEGGAPAPQLVTIAEGQGIAVSQIPAPLASNITACRAYLSNADDPRLFHVRDLAIGMTDVVLGAGGRGDLLETLFMEPAHPGRNLLVKNGRIFSTNGKLLRWTEAQRYGLTDPTHNYLPMGQAITALGSPSDGQLTLYVGGTTKTIMLQGTDVADMKVAAVKHSGIVPGSLIHLDADEIGIDGITTRCPVWIGTNGLFYLGTSSSVIPLNKGVAANIYQKAAATYVEIDGRQRFIVAGRGGRKADLAIRDKAVARIVS